MSTTFYGTTIIMGNWDGNADYTFYANELVPVVFDLAVGGQPYYCINVPTQGLAPHLDPGAWDIYKTDYVKTQTLAPSTTFDYTLTNVNVSGSVTVDVTQMVLNRIYNIKSFANNTTIALSNGNWDYALEGNSYSLLYAGFTVNIQKINNNTVRII